VRQAALVALGQLGDPAGLPALERALDEPNEFNRLFAAQALAGLGIREALSVFVEALDSGNVFIRRWAISVLAPIRGGEMGGYDSRASVSERRLAVARWRAWWREKGASVHWNGETNAFETK
jgi:hypothetical protein